MAIRDNLKPSGASGKTLTEVKKQVSIPANDNSVQFTVTELKAIEYVFIYGQGTNASYQPILYGGYKTNDFKSLVSVSGNVVTFSSYTTTAYPASLTAIIIGEA